MKGLVKASSAQMKSLPGSNSKKIAPSKEELQQKKDMLKPKSKSFGWADEDAALSATVKPSGPHKPKIKAEVTTVPNRKPGGDGMLLTRSHVQFQQDEDEDDLYQDLAPRAPEPKETEVETEDPASEEVTHGDGFRKIAESDEHTGADIADIEQRDLSSEEEQQPVSVEDQAPINKIDKSDNEFLWGKSRSLPTMDDLAESGRLFVRNLAFACTEDDLRKLFGKFGPISEVCSNC